MNRSRLVKRTRRLTGELALIVSGVFLALAAENWWQNRRAAGEARATASLLIADLETDSLRLSALARRLPSRDTVAGRLLLNVRDPAYPADSLANALWTLRFHSSYAPSRASFERLLQSEGLQFVGPMGLQTQTISYFQQRQADVLTWYAYFDTQQEHLMDAAYQYLVPTPTTFEEAMGTASEMNIQVSPSWRKARDDAELINRVWHIKAAGRLLLGSIDRALTANGELRAALRKAVS